MNLKKTLKNQTREYILNLIRDRKLAPGDQLPPQREISQVLNISQKIPEIVLSELEAEHLVIRRRGRGTFLAHPLGVEEEPQEQGKNIFLLLRTLRNQHFAEYAANAEIALIHHKKSLRIATAEAMPDPQSIIEKMIQEGTGGIIACYCPPEIRNFAWRNNVPLVEFHSRQHRGRLPQKSKYIISDLKPAATLLGKHILSLGHRDVYLAGDFSGEKMDLRFAVLMKMLQSSGCRVRYLPQEHPISHYPSYEAAGAELARKMLTEGLPGTAAVFFNTSRAVGAMRYLIQHRISVPDDISILGFDKSCQSGFPEPVITAVSHENEIEMAIHLLLSEKKDIHCISIDPVLLPGTSTGTARKDKVER